MPRVCSVEWAAVETALSKRISGAPKRVRKESSMEVREGILAAEIDVADSGDGLAEEGGAEALELFDGVRGVEDRL